MQEIMKTYSLDDQNTSSKQQVDRWFHTQTKSFNGESMSNKQCYNSFVQESPYWPAQESNRFPKNNEKSEP